MRPVSWSLPRSIARWISVSPMMGHRLRRWSIIGPTLDWRLLLTGRRPPIDAEKLMPLPSNGEA